MAELTPDQQRLAEQAMEIVPAVLADFRRRYRCFGELADRVDLESTAYLAICQAARTYKPEKAGMSAYFSMAIRNRCLSEIGKEIKSQSHSIYRISLEAAEQRQPPKNKPLTDPLLRELEDLPDEVREVIEARVFDGMSFRAFASEQGVSTRQARKQIMSHLDRLAECWREARHG